MNKRENISFQGEISHKVIMNQDFHPEHDPAQVCPINFDDPPSFSPTRQEKVEWQKGASH